MHVQAASYYNRPGRSVYKLAEIGYEIGERPAWAMSDDLAREIYGHRV